MAAPFVWRLKTFVEGTADDISLLLGGQFDKVYGISADTNRKLGIVLGMLLGIQKSISV